MIRPPPGSPLFPYPTPSRFSWRDVATRHAVRSRELAESVLSALELAGLGPARLRRSEEHTSELQSPDHLVCRLLLEKKKNSNSRDDTYNATLETTAVTHPSP